MNAEIKLYSWEAPCEYRYAKFFCAPCRDEHKRRAKLIGVTRGATGAKCDGCGAKGIAKGYAQTRT